MTSATYYDIAMKDFVTLDSLFKVAQETDWYNTLVATCAQIIEKFMKEILTLTPSDSISEHLFSTHNLVTLCHSINSIYPNTVNKEKCAWVGQFYFNARYPGDDFFYVSYAEAVDAIKITKELAQSLIDLHKELCSGHTSFFGGE